MERKLSRSSIINEFKRTGNIKERVDRTYHKKLVHSWINYALYFILTIISLSSLAQKANSQDNRWLSDEIFRLETNVDETNDEVQKIQARIQNCDVSISKSEKIIGLAQQSNNAEAQGIASSALQKARDAKQKNVTSLIAISEYLKKLKGILEYLKSNPKDAEVRLEKFKFESKTDEWMKAKDEDILKRLEAINPSCESLGKSLKINAPPLLVKTFTNLQPGDVILVGRGSETDADLSNVWGKMSSYAINASDQLTSGTTASIASHSLIYLKEINGKKMFLDNVPNKGPTIISEQEYLFKYGNRESEVAQLAQPIKKEQYDMLYDVARELADDQSKQNYQQIKQYNKITDTKYGIGGSDMVCSDASRWVLLQAGAVIPETEDKLKRNLNIRFSPADFCKSPCFLVTPLIDVPKVKAYEN